MTSSVFTPTTGSRPAQWGASAQPGDGTQPVMMTPAMRTAFADTLADAMDEDARLALVLADISVPMLHAAAERHPTRVFNVGIREQLMIGVAGGLGLTGMRAVVHTFPPFLVERPFEQIKIDLGHQDVGAVLVSFGGSYDMYAVGRSHQSPSDVALLDSLHGWTVHVPGHPDEAATLLRSASVPEPDPENPAYAAQGRVYVRLSIQSNPEPQPVDSSGRLRIVREGRRGVVLAVGPMLGRVLAATENLDVTVAYAATVRPFDRTGLRAAVMLADRQDLVLVEPYLAGTSAHLAGEALEDVPHRIRALGVGRGEEVRQYGSAFALNAAHGLDVAGIAASVASFLDQGK